MIDNRLVCSTLVAVLIAGCANTAEAPSSDGVTTPTPATPPPPADRAAILAMAGEYRVTFAFDETVVLARDYVRGQPKRTAGWELVLVVTDEPGRIVLQHILQAQAGHVTKHWRQEWRWEARERFEFTGVQTWHVRPLDTRATAGAWTQSVFEVSDAPRYSGTGRWNHRYGVSTWTSDRTWRPLPRREYTKRSDYNALNVENRHTIVPGGWTHEQDNTKTVREADGSVRTLVREFAFNDYVRTKDVDFTLAREYWRKTADYWARVRDEWQARMAAAGGLSLDTPIDGMPIIDATFDQAERVEGGAIIAPDELRALFDRYVRPPGAAAAR